MKRMCSKILCGKKFQVYVVKNAEGNVEWVSLYDLCRILKCMEMYESEDVLNLCRCIGSFPLYGNGKRYRFIPVYDIHVLLGYIRNESKSLAAVCDEIEKWAASLPACCPSPPTGQAAIKSLKAPATFTFRGYPVSFIKENGKIFLNSTQMARIFGKNPRRWLLLSETLHFRQALAGQSEAGGMDSQIITVRGSWGDTWMEDRLGLEFARRLSPEFHAWCCERMNLLSLHTAGIIPD